MDLSSYRGGDPLHLSAQGLHGVLESIKGFETTADSHAVVDYQIPEWEIEKFISKYNLAILH